MPQMNEIDRNRAIALIMQGQRQCLVDQKYGIDEPTISCLYGRLRDTVRIAEEVSYHMRGCSSVASQYQDTSLACDFR